MRAINHAITGALIGLTIDIPVLAIPFAFASHFVQDALPHYDLAGDELSRLRTPIFLYQLVGDAILCVALVVLLVVARPHHWLLAAVCAFAAASPDLFWIPKFAASRQGVFAPNTRLFLRFHSIIQWKTGPRLVWVEAGWFGVFGGILLSLI